MHATKRHGNCGEQPVRQCNNLRRRKSLLIDDLFRERALYFDIFYRRFCLFYCLIPH